LKTQALLSLLLHLALPVAVQAQFTFKTNNGTITVTGYDGPHGDVSIPATINGLPVTGIGDYAFQNKTSLTNITIPNSVIRIGNWAFSSNGLSSLTIPDGVTNIGYDAFLACTRLTSVTIGTNVTSIAYAAFYDCGRLTTVTIPNSVASIEGYAFWGCNRLTSVTFGTNVISIGEYAFEACTSLTIVTIPNSVTIVGDSAFWDCTSLTSVTVGTNVTSIGDYAFEACTGLTTVTIPNNVTNIGYDAFYDCTHLTGVYFQGNAPGADSSVFSGDNNATVYYMPGTTGWGSTFGGRPSVLWNPQVQTDDPSFGVRTNRFGFAITWASGMVVVVEASTNLVNPLWSPVATNILTDGSSYFRDPQWTNYPARLYRLRSP
jgi:hypothetical protein